MSAFHIFFSRVKTERRIRNVCFVSAVCIEKKTQSIPEQETEFCFAQPKQILFQLELCRLSWGSLLPICVSACLWFILMLRDNLSLERPREAALPQQHSSRGWKSSCGYLSSQEALHLVQMEAKIRCQLIPEKMFGFDFPEWSLCQLIPIATENIHYDKKDTVLLLERSFQLKSFSLVLWYFYQHVVYVWRLCCCIWYDNISLKAVFLMGLLHCCVFSTLSEILGHSEKNTAATIYNDLMFK